MNYRSLISSGSWLVRKLCTASSQAAVEVAALKRSKLYPRLSALAATGGTVSQTLNEFVMEGRRIRKDELEATVRQLRKYRRFQHCLDIMDWMEKRNIQFSYSDHAIRLDLIDKTRGISAAKDYFSALPPNAKNIFTYGALLNCYCNNLMKDEALALFKEMDELKLISKTLPFNNLMCLYTKLEQHEKVSELVDELKRRNIPRCRFTYVLWMQSYATVNDIEGVERVLEELSNDDEDKCTWKTYTNLAAIYLKAGQFEKAEACLKKLERDKMPCGDREAYHFLISLYAGTLNRAEVYRVWEALKRVYSNVTNTSYLVMVQALAKLKDFEGMKKCFEEWDSSCSIYDNKMVTSVIRGYLSGDMLEEAELIFDNAMKRSKAPLTRARELFMVYFLKKRSFDLVLKHMEAAVSENKNWSPIPETITAFFDYLIVEGDIDAAEMFCKHLKKNKRLDFNAYCLLLKTYVAAGKVAPYMRQRLEEDGIELSQELQELLVKVCPE